MASTLAVKEDCKIELTVGSPREDVALLEIRFGLLFLSSL
jgi:hypothetical protein